VATISVAEEDGELVADEFTATLGQDRRTAGEARSVLLAFAGRGALESEAIREHAADDRGAAAAGRLASQERRPNRTLPSRPVGTGVSVVRQ